MSQFRRLFINKPTDPLVEISDRVYVLDCSFSNNIMGEDEYKLYLGGVVTQLQVHFLDTSFMVFNFREGKQRSQISDFLSQYDMPVMDYPSHYQSCPLLPLKKIHRFLRLCESWLDQRNVVLLHCERGGWPVLAFMLSGLLLHTKQCHGEKKTLEMIHSHVPKELFHLFSPLNPKPSQLRYLEYISRRNLWSSSDSPLLLDCLILKDLPHLQGRKGCRPILRVYGQDSKDRTNRSSILLFCTPKTKKHTRLYQQEESILVKLDMQCRVQGDVVLECLHLHDDLVSEEMVFRIMFHTAFVRANSLMVHRDEMDILWDAKDQFPKEFKAEILFSGSDGMVPAVTTATISEDENDFVVVDTASDDSRDSDSFVVVDPSSDDWEATSVLHFSQAAASPPPPPPLPTYSSRSQKNSQSQTSQPPPPPPPPPFASKRPNNGRKVLPLPPLPQPRKFVYDSTPARCYTSQSAPTSPPPPPPPPPPPFRYVNDIMLPPTWTFEAHVACSASSSYPPPPPTFSSSNKRKAIGVRIPPPPPLPYKRIAPSPSPKAPPSPTLPPTKTTPPPPSPFSNVRSTLPPPPPPIPFGKTSAPPPPPPLPPLFKFGESRPAPLPPMYRAPHRSMRVGALPFSMRGGAPLPPPPPSPPPGFGGRRAALIQRGPEERMRMTLPYYNHLCLLDQVTNGY